PASARRRPGSRRGPARPVRGTRSRPDRPSPRRTRPRPLPSRGLRPPSPGPVRPIGHVEPPRPARVIHEARRLPTRNPSRVTVRRTTRAGGSTRMTASSASRVIWAGAGVDVGGAEVVVVAVLGVGVGVVAVVGAGAGVGRGEPGGTRPGGGVTVRVAAVGFTAIQPWVNVRVQTPFG